MRGIIEIEMRAGEALAAGVFAGACEGFKINWFAQWAIERPSDSVYCYVIDGMGGNFIYGERADYQTLAEFVRCTDSQFEEMWQRYIAAGVWE